MVSKAKIKEAVQGLDHGDDASWTASGLPSVDAVSSALGERVTREEISDAAGDMRRDASQASDGTATDPADEVKVVDGDAREPKGNQPELKAAQPTDDNLSDGPEPDEVFGMLDQIAAAASSPRWRRNQTLQQIKTLWANDQKAARESQEKIEGRIERRAEKREERKAEAR